MSGCVHGTVQWPASHIYHMCSPVSQDNPVGPGAARDDSMFPIVYLVGNRLEELYPERYSAAPE